MARRTRRTTPLQKKTVVKKDTVTARFKAEVEPLGQFFRQWREYRVMKVEEAAGLAGMSTSNLYAMERGETGFSTPGLKALADVYQTIPAALLVINPLEEGEGLLVKWARASEADRRMIADMADVFFKSREKDRT